MGTFTLTQIQTAKDLYLLPDAAGCEVPSTTIIVRPSGDSAIQLSPFPGTGEDNYEDVDEAIADDDTTYTFWNTPLQQKIDRYSFTIPDKAKIVGTPTSIKVYIRVRRAGATDAGIVTLGIGVGTPGGDNCSWYAHGAAMQAWTDYTNTFNTNPDTGNPWTWAELEAATLTAGVVTNNGDEGRCTQIYAEITYSHTHDYTQVDDPVDNPDDDETYIHNATAAVIPELFNVENHTTESGIINYLQTYARAKTHETAPHIDTVYKVLLDDSTCTDTQKSYNFDLVTSYTTYTYVWKTNPFTDTAFTWDNIDNYQIGIECSSPAITGESLNSTFRPNAPGTFTDWTPHGAANNWDCVDEEVADGDSTYIKNETGSPFYAYDSYHIPNHTTENGVIKSVAVFYRVQSYGDYSCHRPFVYIGGVRYYGYDLCNQDSTYTLYGYTWAENPDTSTTWTWNDLDNLEIGLRSRSLNSKCTQMYMVVEYYPASFNPEIRTTQVYTKVNYTPNPSTCSLMNPAHISTDHTRNIKMLNFWNGSREVYDLNRSGKSMVLIGSEMYEGACDRIICVRNLARDGNIVTVSELSLGYFNGNYRICQFGWKKIGEKPEHYEWILELEDNEL